MILDVQNISKAFSEVPVLSGVSFHIEQGEKCGLVGINGAGKSTLLRIIAGEESADLGLVSASRGISVGYQAQNQELVSDLAVLDELLTVKAGVLDLEQEMRASELRMKELSDDALTAEMNRYARMSEEFERRDGYALKSEAVGVLKGLGFPQDDFSKCARHLSGGQKTRLALGKLLLAKPDLILLDEPTNHLDLRSLVWLENYLRSYRGAVLVVSHDRYFLNRIVTKVLEIDRTRLTVFSGSYDDYSRKKEALIKSAWAAYLKNEQIRKHQEAVVEKLRSFNREKSLKRANSHQKMLDRMETVERPESDEGGMKLRLVPSVESGRDVLSAEELAQGYAGTLLFRGLSFDVHRGERIAVIGENGTGKSTLLKTINGMLPLKEGELRFGTNVTVGYYDQEFQQLHDEKTVYEEIADSFPDLVRQEIFSILAAFSFFGEDVEKEIGVLSGGERARVSLAKLVLSKANFLLLDEPTNHLDIRSREILEQALTSYDGTILCVSHDRYFINRTATRIFELENGQLHSFEGTYDEYAAWKEERASAAAAVSAAGQGSSPAQQTASKAEWLAKKEQEAAVRKRENAIARTEARIGELEEEIRRIDESLSDPAVACDPEQCLSFGAARADAENELQELYEKWEALQSEASC